MKVKNFYQFEEINVQSKRIQISIKLHFTKSDFSFTNKQATTKKLFQKETFKRESENFLLA